MDNGNQLDKALEDMLLKIEIERVRPLQRKMHLKLAECYNSKSTNQDDIDRCCQKHIAPAEAANGILDFEVNQMQSRIERCAQMCGDEIWSKYSKESSKQGEAVMQECLAGCGEKHLQYMKSVQSSIEKQLDDISKKHYN